MNLSDVLTMDAVERLVKDMAHDYDLPEPEVAQYEEPARHREVVQIWFRHNMRKYSVEVMYNPSRNADALDMFAVELEDAMHNLREELYLSDTTITRCGHAYMMSWEQQDYFEIVCPTCEEREWLPFKNRSMPDGRRDLVMCYLLGELDCQCI